MEVSSRRIDDVCDSYGAGDGLRLRRVSGGARYGMRRATREEQCCFRRWRYAIKLLIMPKEAFEVPPSVLGVGEHCACDHTAGLQRYSTRTSHQSHVASSARARLPNIFVDRFG
jgi:hypothetical protein